MIQEWFTDAKLGIFIHWGIYAANPSGESWPIFRGHMSHKEYHCCPTISQTLSIVYGLRFFPCRVFDL